MAKRTALINFNVPKVGRVKVSKVGLATTAVSLALIAAAWNWSSHIPYVGEYADKAKILIRRGLGAGGGGSVGFMQEAMVA